MPKVEKFTAHAISKLRLPAGSGQQDYFEHLHPGRSVILTLNSSGKRTWSALFYEKGRPRRKKLGEYPAMSVRAARAAAVKLDTGRALAGARAGTFEAVAEKYLSLHVKKMGLRSEDEIRRLLGRWDDERRRYAGYVYPRWAKRRFTEIRRSDVAELLDEIEGRHGSGVADSVLAVIRGLMNWHQTRDEDYVTPIVRGMRRRRPPKRGRWLDDAEIKALWNACEGEATFGAICRVLLLTGQRRSKVAGMRWSDVDLDSGEWRIPREEREKGTPQAITLPDTALDIVRAQPRIAENAHVFAGRGKGPFDGFSKSKERLDAKLEFAKPWRLHDLRRTCRALMTRQGVQTEIAELALGHTLTGVQAHYDNPKEYRPRIDQALRLVAAEVARIVEEPERRVITYPR